MAKVELKERYIETDVLCIGGGIAGLMGAIRAAEGGAKVIVAEKSNVLYSGSGGIGDDHFMCYIPEVHGPDIEPMSSTVRARAKFRLLRIKMSSGTVMAV